MIFDIVQGNYRSRAKVISVNDLQNFYPEVVDNGKGKNVKALIGCPGYRLVGTANDSGTGRGLYKTSTERFFTVVNNKLFEMSIAEAFTERGTLNTSTGMCVFSDNGTQLLITDGTYGYIYTLATNTLARITDVDYPVSTSHCIFTDGYFLVNAGGTGQFYFSSSYDGSAWAGLDFATAEYSADNLQGIAKTSNGTIWMIGKQSVELWSNVGTADLPWRRISGSVREIGCIAPYSIASNGDQVFFLGNGASGYGAVYMGQGYDIQKISNPAIEYQIKQLVNINTAVAYTYSDEGHSFYVISFTTEKTFVYDITTGEWHTRGTYNSVTGNSIRQFSQGYAFFNGKHYVGNYLNGTIYEMGLDIYSEGTNPIKREIVTGHIHNENQRLRHLKVELEIERGTGLVGEDAPKIMMQFSNDGGNTWSSEYWKDAGKIGEYKARAIWHRVGMARDRVYRFVMTDAVQWTIANAYIEVMQ